MELREGIGRIADEAERCALESQAEDLRVAPILADMAPADQLAWTKQQAQQLGYVRGLMRALAILAGEA